MFYVILNTSEVMRIGVRKIKTFAMQVQYVLDAVV